MNTSNDNENYKLLILDRIKDPSRANAVMELIANKHGDDALLAIIDEMETVDIARLFTEAFDYTKPNQAAGLIQPDVAEDCILAILARRSSNRIKEEPRGPVQDINDFLASVILTRPIESQAIFKELIEDHLDLVTACMMCDLDYHGDSLLESIYVGEQGTMAEIVKNLGLTEDLVRTVKNAMQASITDRGNDSDENHFDSESEARRLKFIRRTLLRFHDKAIKRFGAEVTSSMEDFMEM